MAPVGLPNLPPKLLDDIARRAGPLDNIVCSAVCSPWRRALKTTRLRRLRTPNRPGRVELWREYGGAVKVTVSALHHADGTVGTAVLSDSGGDKRPTRIIGCSHGWLVTVDEACGVSLLDPFTGRLFPLPPITTSRSKKVTKDLEQMGFDGMFQKAVLVPGRRLGSFAVMLIHSGGFGLSFLRPGARSWTTLRVPKWMSNRYLDAIFHKGAFYTVSLEGEVNAWVPDASSSGLRVRRVTDPRPERIWSVLVESIGGHDLLMVTMGDNEPWDPNRRREYKVSRYDEGEGRWLPVEDLGKVAILVGSSCSLCTVPRAGRSHDVARNHLYFARLSTAYCNDGYERRHPLQYRLPSTAPTGCGYDYVPHPVGGGASWFLPHGRP